MGGNDGDEGEDGGEGGNALDVDDATMAELEQLIANPAFQQLRAQVRQNPQILGAILQYLQQSNPRLYNVNIGFLTSAFPGQT